MKLSTISLIWQEIMFSQVKGRDVHKFSGGTAIKEENIYLYGALEKLIQVYSSIVVSCKYILMLYLLYKNRPFIVILTYCHKHCLQNITK